MLDGIKKVLQDLKEKFDAILENLESKEDASGAENLQTLNNVKHIANKALVEAQSQIANTQILDPNMPHNPGVGQLNPGQTVPVTPPNNSSQMTADEQKKSDEAKADKAKKDADKATKAKDTKETKETDKTDKTEKTSV